MLRSGKNPPPMSQYSFDRPYPQQFSLPHPMVLYMIKRHKAVNLHVKFMKLCKYAYAKNRIVPVSQINFVYRKRKPFWTAIWMTNTYGRAKFDLQNGKFKLWVLPRINYFSSFLCNSNLSDIASKLAPKIYRFEERFNFENQIVSLMDFKVLTNSTNGVMNFGGNVIKYSDGANVPFDVILENLLHVSTLRYDFAPFKNDESFRTPINIKNMAEVLSRPSNQIRKLQFFGLTESFDISLFTPFLLKEKSVDIFLSFKGELSDLFKRKLETVIDQMIQAFPPQDFPVVGCPSIHYNGLSEDKNRKICRVRCGPRRELA